MTNPEQDAHPGLGAGTDIDAADLDLSAEEDGGDGDTPATSDPDAHVDDATLGGTGGGSAGGAG